MCRGDYMNVFIYLRKSRKDIEEERKRGDTYDTLSRHRQTLLALIKREQFDLAREPFEEVVSGESITERPRMLEMLKCIENGEADAVVVMDLDRLGRGDMLDQGMIDRAFRYSGTLLITPTETYDPNSQEWELVFGIKSLVARGELKAITRRMQGGRRHSAKEGKSISKKPPYGFTRDENLILHPDPNTDWVVKKIFDMVANGSGRQAVSNELDKLGIAPPNPEREYWSPSMVTSIVKNEVYKGDIIWGKFNYKKRHGKYEKSRVDKKDWIIKTDAHEAIVSSELWEKANASHSSRNRPPSTNLDKKLSNPLAGILKCALCDRSMLNIPRVNRRSSMLRCVNPACKGMQKSSYLDVVELSIIQALDDYVKRLEIDSPVEDKEDVVLIKEKAVQKKQKELAGLIKQKNSLHDFLEKGIYDINTFLERQEVLLEKIKDVESVIKELQKDINKEKMQNRNVKETIPAIRGVIEAYNHTEDVEKKNRLLKSVLEKATYRRQKDWEKFEILLYPRI
ncbi:recombinase family protein [Peribacillus frigoritolerans]|uniref:recombinase family protein n=1 Tax=Peribacillus frigoritolerans TaxID=450367 RepID=UPI0039C0B5C5